jgi:hypothetical protein
MNDQPESGQVAAITTVPRAQRISRAMLIVQTDKYYSGMESNNPRGDYTSAWAEPTK